jgi:hypothetical protein
MVGKGLRFLVLTALAVHVARQWPDVVRYLKIKQLSVGRGHPEERPLRWKSIGQGQTPRTGRPLRAEVIGPNTGWAVAASLPT